MSYAHKFQASLQSLSLNDAAFQGVGCIMQLCGGGFFFFLGSDQLTKVEHSSHLPPLFVPSRFVDSYSAYTHTSHTHTHEDTLCPHPAIVR